MADPPALCDVAVLVRTVLRPSLATAIRSVYAQDFPGRVQILVGVDAIEDRDGLIAGLRAECPAGMTFTALDLGYPTSRARGGLYPNRCGGVLPVLLAYAAQARRIVFLDDDNWLAPDHIRALDEAIKGFDWAFTLRWYADGASGRSICVDEWESAGPGQGVYAKTTGGFVDLNCLMIDKVACHYGLPWLASAAFADGTGEDRMLFNFLRERHSVGWTRRPTLYYAIRRDDPMDEFRRQWFAERGIAMS